MAIKLQDIKKREEIESVLQQSLDPASPTYDDDVATLDELGRSIDSYYASQRQVDEKGRLTAQPKTRKDSFAMNGSDKDSFSFHFEPSRAEAAALLKKNPQLIKDLRLEKYDTPKTDAMHMPVYSPFGGVISYNIHPAQSGLDYMDPNDGAYKRVADYLWDERVKQAMERGENVKRYRDVYLDEDPKAFTKGAMGYMAEKQLAPTALGLADSMAFGQGTPALDAAHDLSQYRSEQGADVPAHNQTITDPMSGAPMGEAPVAREYRAPGEGYVFPSSEEVINRSPGAYGAGLIGGYFLPGNATNKMAGAMTEGLLGAGVPRLVAAGTTGALTSVAEGAAGDFSRSYLGGKSAGEAGFDAMVNAPFNAIAGGTIGASLDPAAWAAEKVQTGMRVGDPDIKAFERAGGRMSILKGVRSPKRMEELNKRATETGQKGTAGAIAADEIAPGIKSSIETRDAKLKEKHLGETEAYYNHPAYRDLQVSSKPLVEKVVDLARRGAFYAPLTGETSNFNQNIIRTVQEELRASKWAQPRVVSIDDAGALAHRVDGVVVDVDTGRAIFGADLIKGGRDKVVVIAPAPMGARDITSFEDKIYAKLKPDASGNRTDDVVYNELENTIKPMMRDKFPAFEDEAGNLTGPPSGPSDQQPFQRVDELPPEEMRNLGRPVEITGSPEPVPRPEGLMGVGPGGPPLPDTFDPRAAIRREPSIQPQGMLDVRGSSLDPTPRPEGLMGVGPEPNYIPRNPFEVLPSTPQVDAPPIQPDQQLRFDAPPQEPDFIEPEALMGAGPRRDRSVFDPDLQGQRDITGGEYSEPPWIGRPPLPDETPPSGPPTARMGGPVPQRGDIVRQPVHEGEFIEDLPPGEAIELGGSYGGGGYARDLDLPEGYGPEIDLLEGNSLALDRAPESAPVEEPLPPSSLPESAPAAAPDPRSALGQFPAKERVQLAEVRARLAGMPREEQDALLKQMQRDGELVLYRNDNPRSITPDDAAAAMDVGGSPRHLVYFTPKAKPQARPEEPPMPAAMRDTSAERAADLTAQGTDDVERSAFEEANRQIDDVESRFGKFDELGREKSLLAMMSHKLGREVTKEDLIKLGLVGAGAGLMATDDPNLKLAGSVVAGAAITGGGKGTKKPIEAKLDDGKTIQGFSALRRRQHLEQNEVEQARINTGAANDQTLRNRIKDFDRSDNTMFDAALENEAKRIGKEGDLYMAPGASVYPEMAQRAWGTGTRRNATSRVLGFAGTRADALLGALAGKRNSFEAGPEGIMGEMWEAMIRNPSRRVLDMSGGKHGARFGNDAQESIREYLFGPDYDEKEKERQRRYHENNP